MLRLEWDINTVPMIGFDELFDRASITRDQKVGRRYETVGPEELKQIDLGPGKRYNRHTVTGFVCTSHGQWASFYARPTDRLVRMACEVTVAIQHDSIFFSVVRHEAEGFVAVYAKNNQIINSGPPIARVPIGEWPS